MQQQSIWLFLITVLALIVTPGPDMIYVAGRSLGQGRRAAALSALGISIGYVGHTLLVTLGLTSVVAASPVAFRIIQIGGAGYLIYLACRILLAKSVTTLTGKVKRTSFRLLLLQGALTSLLNPKGLLFYFALLPQFCTPGPISQAIQVLSYGLLTSLLCMIVYSFVGLAISTTGRFFVQNHAMQQLLPKISGSILLGLGIYLLKPFHR